MEKRRSETADLASDAGYSFVWTTFMMWHRITVPGKALITRPDNAAMMPPLLIDESDAAGQLLAIRQSRMFRSAICRSCRKARATN